MKVFADLHHAGLYNSLKMLFEDRLGAELYRPCGMAWADEGYWQIHKPYHYSPDTAKQYLDIKSDYQPKDGTQKLNTVVGTLPTHYEIQEIAHDYIQKAITLEQFRSMKFDYIIASIPDHYVTFTQLRDIYQPQAKVICHMGNMFDEIHELIKEGVVKNLLASTIQFDTYNINRVFYHQEFDLSLFKPDKNITTDEYSIRSFVNLLPAPETYDKLKDLLTGYQLEAYGSSCPDGLIHTQKQLARKMQSTMFGYHNKPRCDGYGHVIHNWYAVGKPVIANVREYEHYMAGSLMIEGQNCIALDNGDSLQQIADKIIEASEPQKYAHMCQASYNSFKSLVDFDIEEQTIRAFLDRAI